MRVLVLTNLYPNPFQPRRAPFNRHQLRILAQSHAVRVIAPIAWTDELKARWRGAARLPKGRTVLHDGLTVEHPRYWFVPQFLRGHYGHMYRASVAGAFQRSVKDFKPDLVFAPWAYPDGWAAVRLGRQAKLPVVIQVHGSDVLLLDQFPSRKARTVEAVREADAIVAVSQDIANHLIGYGVPAHRIRVIYDGVDPSVFCPGSKKESRGRLGIVEGEGVPVLLFIGNLVPVKAIGVLLEACAILQRKGGPFKLIVVGEGPLRAALEQQAVLLGIAQCVRFLGGLPQQELPDWYRAADLFVLPSHSEGVPNVLLEASACGTPYVASRVGGIPEIAHLGKSLLVQPNDPQSLADALSQALAAPNDGVVPRSRDRAAAVGELAAFLQDMLAAANLGGAQPRPALVSS